MKRSPILNNMPRTKTRVTSRLLYTTKDPYLHPHLGYDLIINRLTGDFFKWSPAHQVWHHVERDFPIGRAMMAQWEDDQKVGFTPPAPSGTG